MEKKYLFIIVFSLIFASCQEHIDPLTREDISNNIVLNDAYERLSFLSEDDLHTAIKGGDDMSLVTRSGTFVSLLSNTDKVKSMIDSTFIDSEVGEITYYEALGYDSLIPNPDFARLFNLAGELEVSGDIIKVTPNGTYRYPIEKEDYFKRLYFKNPNLSGELIEDRLCKITDDIFLYKTFEENESDYVLDFKGSFDEIIEEGVSEIEYPVTRAAPEPNFDSFPQYSTEKKTWLGKLIQNIIGTPKTWEVKFNSKRRVKSKFYSYNYGVYAEIGVSGWTDKKNFIGWSQTASDELRVGWKGVLLETKVSDTFAQSVKNINKNIQYGTQYVDLPGTKYKVNTQTLIIPNIDLDAWQKAVNQGAPYVLKLVKSWATTPSDIDKAKALVIASRTKIFTYILDDNVIRYNTKKYTHIFANQFKIMITINPYNLPQLAWEDALKWASLLSETTKMNYPTLVAGDTYCCARFGNDWRGMKIRKHYKK